MSLWSIFAGVSGGEKEGENRPPFKTIFIFFRGFEGGNGRGKGSFIKDIIYIRRDWETEECGGEGFWEGVAFKIIFLIYIVRKIEWDIKELINKEEKVTRYKVEFFAGVGGKCDDNIKNR